MSDSILCSCKLCGAKNRVPVKHLSDTGRCGACKESLPPASEPIDADTKAFDEIINGAKVPVLVDFWAAWCGPCRTAAPAVRQLARETAGRGLVLKVDTEAFPGLAARFGIQSIPAFIVFRGGKPALQRAGVASCSDMRGWMSLE